MEAPRANDFFLPARFLFCPLGNLLGGTLQTRSAGWRVLSLSRAISDDLVPRLTASRLPQELLQLLGPRRLLADLHLLSAALRRPLLRLRGGAEGQLSEGVRNPARHAGRGCGVGTPALWLTGPTPAGRRPRCFLVLSYADSQIRPPRPRCLLRACDPFAGGAGGEAAQPRERRPGQRAAGAEGLYVTTLWKPL